MTAISTSAAASTAITAGRLSPFSAPPMGQVRRSKAAGSCPRARYSRSKRRRLVAEPIRPAYAASPRPSTAAAMVKSSAWLCVRIRKPLPDGAAAT